MLTKEKIAEYAEWQWGDYDWHHDVGEMARMLQALERQKSVLEEILDEFPADDDRCRHGNQRWFCAALGCAPSCDTKELVKRFRAALRSDRTGEDEKQVSRG